MRKAKIILIIVAAVWALSAAYLEFRTEEIYAVIYVEFIQKTADVITSRGYFSVGDPLSDRALMSVVEQEGLFAKWNLDTKGEALEMLRSKIRHASLRGMNVDVISVEEIDGELGERILNRIVESWRLDLEESSQSHVTIRVLDGDPR